MAQNKTKKEKTRSTKSESAKAKHPDWSALNPREIEPLVVELAKNGKSTSEIGMILRDQYAVPDVKIATGKKIAQILEENNIKTEIPEDMRNLINKSLQLKKHLEVYKKDFKNKRNLQLVESRIRRLTKYYTAQGVLPEGWHYNPQQAKIMTE